MTFGDDYPALEVGGEGRWPLAKTAKNRSIDIGLYAVARRFLSDASLNAVDTNDAAIQKQFEVGWSLGADPPLRLAGVELPRVGLSYRWSDGLAAWRFNLGFPF